MANLKRQQMPGMGGPERAAVPPHLGEVGFLTLPAARHLRKSILL